jgi:heptosyltransferase III
LKWEKFEGVLRTLLSIFAFSVLRVSNLNIRASQAAGTLVLRGGAIGDFVVTLPLLETLRRSFPNEPLEVVANPAPASLALATGLVDAVHSIESAEFAPFFANDAVLPKTWSERFRIAARVVSFLEDPGEVLARNARRAGGRSWIVGPHRPADGQGLAARQLAAPIERALALPAGDPAAFRLHLDCAAHEEAELILQRAPWIAIHPGSGSPQKNWPIARWIELAGALLRQRSNLRLLLLGGEADADILESLRRELPADRILAVEQSPLPRVAALIAACDLFLGGDSGIAHVAAATGVPCVLLFGPSDPTVWAPPQSRARIIRAERAAMDAILVREVLEEVAAGR